MVEKFPANGSYEPLINRMRAGRIGNALDLIDIQDAKIGRPSMQGEQRSMVRETVLQMADKC